MHRLSTNTVGHTPIRQAEIRVPTSAQEQRHDQVNYLYYRKPSDKPILNKRVEASRKHGLHVMLPVGDNGTVAFWAGSVMCLKSFDSKDLDDRLGGKDLVALFRVCDARDDVMGKEMRWICCYRQEWPLHIGPRSRFEEMLKMKSPRREKQEVWGKQGPPIRLGALRVRGKKPTEGRIGGNGQAGGRHRRSCWGIVTRHAAASESLRPQSRRVRRRRPGPFHHGPLLVLGAHTIGLS
jgi:hypothetical protein